MDNDSIPEMAEGPALHPISPWDSRLFVALRTKGHFQPMELMLKLLSQAGNWGLFWAGLAGIIWIAGAATGRGLFILTIMFTYPTLAVNYIVKVLVGRERPAVDDPHLLPLVRVPASKSFPSSHAAMSFAAAAAMTYYYPAFAPVFYLLALVMSWTRVYLGVHYPSDVLAGMGIGLVCSFVWLAGLTTWLLG